MNERSVMYTVFNILCLWYLQHLTYCIASEQNVRVGQQFLSGKELRRNLDIKNAHNKLTLEYKINQNVLQFQEG